MNTLEKTVKTGRGFKTRLHIKTFKESEAMHKFLNKQNNNDWQESDKDLKRGIYAYAGGQYHNIKSLDSSILAHI